MNELQYTAIKSKAPRRSDASGMQQRAKGQRLSDLNLIRDSKRSAAYTQISEDSMRKNARNKVMQAKNGTANVNRSYIGVALAHQAHANKLAAEKRKAAAIEYERKARHEREQQRRQIDLEIEQYYTPNPQKIQRDEARRRMLLEEKRREEARRAMKLHEAREQKKREAERLKAEKQKQAERMRQQEACSRSRSGKNEENRKPVAIEAGQRKRKGLASTLLLIGYVFVVVSCVLMRYANISNASYQNSQLESEISDMAGQMDRLKMDIALKDDLNSIQQIAFTKLGMRAPMDGQVFYIDLSDEEEDPSATASIDSIETVAAAEPDAGPVQSGGIWEGISEGMKNLLN